MAELVQDPGFRLTNGEVSTEWPQVVAVELASAREQITGEQPIDCGSCLFRNRCDSAAYNAGIQYHQIGAELYAEFSDDPMGRADRLIEAAKWRDKQIGIARQVGSKADSGQCPGGLRQQVETTYQSPAYEAASNRRFGAFRQWWMRVQGQQFATHVRVRTVCNNPAANAAMEAGLDFTEPGIRISYT